MIGIAAFRSATPFPGGAAPTKFLMASAHQKLDFPHALYPPRSVALRYKQLISIENKPTISEATTS